MTTTSQDRKIADAGARFRALASAGVIAQYVGAHSPEDTLADTRFTVVEHTSGTRVIFWREVEGYLAGAESGVRQA